MSEISKKSKNDDIKNNKMKITIKGIDIDKNEYQEIVLSNSNFPEKDFFKSYYD